MSQLFGQRIVTSWYDKDYMRDTSRASRKAVKEVVKMVARDARKAAPKGRKQGKLHHRVRRVYPGGRVYHDLKPMRRQITTFTRKGKGRNKLRVVAGVAVKVGYAVFNIFGHDIIGRGGRKHGHAKGTFFIHDALARNAKRIFQILRRKMPK